MKIKPLSDDSLMARCLAWLAGVVFRHRRLFFYPQLVLFVALHPRTRSSTSA